MLQSQSGGYYYELCRTEPVTDTIEIKAAAVECHRTQFAGQSGWAGEAVRRRAAEEGRRVGVGYAEGFRRLTLGA